MNPEAFPMNMLTGLIGMGQQQISTLNNEEIISDITKIVVQVIDIVESSFASLVDTDPPDIIRRALAPIYLLLSGLHIELQEVPIADRGKYVIYKSIRQNEGQYIVATNVFHPFYLMSASPLLNWPASYKSLYERQYLNRIYFSIEIPSDETKFYLGYLHNGIDVEPQQN